MSTAESLRLLPWRVEALQARRVTQMALGRAQCPEAETMYGESPRTTTEPAGQAQSVSHSSYYSEQLSPSGQLDYTPKIHQHPPAQLLQTSPGPHGRFNLHLGRYGCKTALSW